MATDKLELARTVLEEFSATQRASDWFADDVVFDFSEFRGWIEESEYHGRNGFDQQLERWTAPFDSWAIEVTDLRDPGGDDVLVVGVQRGVVKGTGAVVEMALADVVTIRDDKIVRIRIFAAAEDAYEAAGLEPPARSG